MVSERSSRQEVATPTWAGGHHEQNTQMTRNSHALHQNIEKMIPVIKSYKLQLTKSTTNPPNTHSSNQNVACNPRESTICPFLSKSWLVADWPTSPRRVWSFTILSLKCLRHGAATTTTCCFQPSQKTILYCLHI